MTSARWLNLTSRPSHFEICDRDRSRSTEKHQIKIRIKIKILLRSLGLSIIAIRGALAGGRGRFRSGGLTQRGARGKIGVARM
jgi:hypothetical protein